MVVAPNSLEHKLWVVLSRSERKTVDARNYKTPLVWDLFNSTSGIVEPLKVGPSKTIMGSF